MDGREKKRTRRGTDQAAPKKPILRYFITCRPAPNFRLPSAPLLPPLEDLLEATKDGPRVALVASLGILYSASPSR